MAEARRVRTKDRSLSLGRTIAVNVGTHPRPRGVAGGTHPAPVSRTLFSTGMYVAGPGTEHSRCTEVPASRLRGPRRGHRTSVCPRGHGPAPRGLCCPPPPHLGLHRASSSSTAAPGPGRPARPGGSWPGPLALPWGGQGRRSKSRSYEATRILISERPDPLTTLRMGRPGLPSWSVHGRSWARQGREAPQGSLGSTRISPCQSVQAGGGPAAVCESRGKSDSNTRIRRPSLERLSRRVWSENQKICLFFFLNKQSK